MENSLTSRQQLTLKHLADKGITNPQDIANWCIDKLALPQSNNKTALKKRKHSRTHYMNILAFVGKQNK